MEGPNGVSPKPPLVQHRPPNYSFATLGIHGDDGMQHSTDVSPALHVSTTFRYPRDPSQLIPEDKLTQPEPSAAVPDGSYVYSRYMAPNSSRLELMLAQLLDGPCLTYSSGLSAFHALLVYLHPKVVAIGAGYHGCHGVLKLYQKLTNCKIVDLFDEKSWDTNEFSLGKGDVVHLETPVNPTGKAYNIQHFAELAHKRGAYLTLDSTFGPPPLQEPFKWGTDFVMHSGTKYIGGHSDMLCGVIAINRQKANWEEDYWGMLHERNVLGSVIGNLEGWLGVRSLRTMELRVRRQSDNCGKLVAFLHACLSGQETSHPSATTVRKTLAKIEHASLQKDDMSWLSKQMPNGYGPVFSIWLSTPEQAKALPSKLHLFHHATSLGGVESLIEWRRMSDAGVEETLCRVSVGAEGWEDLRDDVVQGLEALVKEGV